MTTPSTDRTAASITTAAEFVDRLSGLGSRVDDVPMREVLSLAGSSLGMPLPRSNGSSSTRLRELASAR